MKYQFLCTASAAGLVLGATPATAQQTADGAARIEQSSAAATTAAGQDDGSADIVVTALRSNQSLQRTPAAVTAVSGDQLVRQQITDIRGIQALAPAARFSAANTSTRIYIRGVGSALDFYWIPETTAVNLNGVYVPRFATTGSLFDVDSVQILPGPQGVLYGRSAGGGAVVIGTKRPVDRAEAAGSFEYGNFNSVHIEGMGNVPVTDDLAVRGAFALNKRDGYQDFGLQADDSFSVRLSALYRPTDALSIFLWGTHFKQTGKPSAAQYIPHLAGHDPWFVPKVDPVTGSDNTTGSRMKYQYTLVGGQIEYDLGGATVEYNAAFLHQTEDALRKLVGNDQVVDNGQRQYVQNLHLSGTSGALSYVGGIDWFYAKSRYDVRFGPRQFGNIFPSIKQRSVSGFAQLTYALNPGLRLTGGARYTRDSLSIVGTNIACFATCVLPPVNFDKTWHHLDLKGGIEVDVAPKVLAYANIQTGYAPGTLNTYANTVSLSKEILPQKLLAYTAGIKSTLADGVVTLNLEGFEYAYRKLIIQAFNASLGQQSLFNVPKARVYGLQLMSSLRPTTADTLSANLAYTHGAYGHYLGTAGTGPARDLDGLQMVYTPTWTGTISYDHRFDLRSGATIDARVSTYISSSYWGTFDHSANVRQGAYTKTDLSLIYHAPDNAYSFGAWIKNVENTAVNTALSTSGYAAPYSAATFLEPPRTYGVTLSFTLR